MTETVRFTWELVKAFRDLSYDLNPLHLDPLYSRRTPYGQPVVYGMCLALYGIARWAKGRIFSLEEIKAQFKKPLYIDEAYDLEVSENDNQVTLRYAKNGSLLTKIVFTYSEDVPQINRIDATSSRPFVPLTETKGHHDLERDMENLKGCELHYRYNNSNEPAMARLFGLSGSQLPAAQLNSLFWASYFVGMVMPGKQALFTDLAMKYRDSGRSDFAICLTDIDWDERFKQFRFAGNGTGIESFSISAFQRPEAFTADWNQIQREIGKSETFKGKVVFVSGSSRGFGEVLAKALALKGARVLINYYVGKDDAKLVSDEISNSGGEAFALQGDVGNPDDCARMMAEIQRCFGGLDMLINNAAPTIPSVPFARQSTLEFTAFMQRCLQMTLEPTHQFLPMIRAGGTILNISSVYTQKPQAGFSHYIAAKASIEALARVLSLEHQAIKFVIVRPPRMRTDQTNLAYDRLPAASPITVAAQLLMRLEALSGEENFFELNLEGAE